MPTNDRISQLKPGQSKEEVLSLLGAPSSVVSLDKNTWIYMSSEVKQVAFFKPTEIDRDVLTIKFDKYDQVADIDRLNKKNGTEVAVSTDATQTLGQEPGFFEKYFGFSDQGFFVKLFLRLSCFFQIFFTVGLQSVILLFRSGRSFFPAAAIQNLFGFSV